VPNTVTPRDGREPGLAGPAREPARARAGQRRRRPGALTVRGGRGHRGLGSRRATLHPATARLAAPDESDHGIVVDLLFASSGIEPEIAARADRLEVFSGVAAPVAQIGDLIALKLLARDDQTRPQDAVDLRALLAAAGDRDVVLARESVELIARRGCARGRDLAAALAAALGEFRG